MPHAELSLGNSNDILQDIVTRFKIDDLQIKNSTHNVAIADERFVIKSA